MRVPPIASAASRPSVWARVDAGAGDNTLIVDERALYRLTEQRGADGKAVMTIHGDAGDQVRLAGLGWTPGADVTSGSVTLQSL